MRAEEAMQAAAADLIKTDAGGGLVTIYRSKSAASAGWDCHLRFIPRDKKGNLNMGGNVLVGTYDSLAKAVAVAHDKYSATNEGWNPQDQVELVEDNHGALQVEGRADAARSGERTGS